MVGATSSKFLRSSWYKFYGCQRTSAGGKCVDCWMLLETGNGLEPPNFTSNGPKGGTVMTGGASFGLCQKDGGGVGLLRFRGESQRPGRMYSSCYYMGVVVHTLQHMRKRTLDSWVPGGSVHQVLAREFGNT